MVTAAVPSAQLSWQALTSFSHPLAGCFHTVRALPELVGHRQLAASDTMVSALCLLSGAVMCFHKACCWHRYHQGFTAWLALQAPSVLYEEVQNGPYSHQQQPTAVCNSL